MTTFGEVLRSLREKSNYTRESLAREINISSQALYYYEKDRKKPSSDVLIKISQALGVSTDKLLGLEAEKTLEERKVDLKVIPVLGKICAGNGTQIPEEQVIIDYVSIPNNKKADFGLVITGDSMQPKLQEGDIALIQKQDSLNSGEIGAIAFNQHEAVVKKFVQVEPSVIYLNSLNTNYPPIIIRKDEITYIKIFGKVVGKISWDV